MPITLPSVSDFTTRFPIFVGNDPAVITALIAEAANMVDDTWIVTDQIPGILYLTAHLLATDNSASGEEVSLGPTGSNIISSESFGGISLSYQSGQGGVLSASEQFGQTVYGRRFLAMLKRNKTGPVAV